MQPNAVFMYLSIYLKPTELQVDDVQTVLYMQANRTACDERFINACCRSFCSSPLSIPWAGVCVPTGGLCADGDFLISAPLSQRVQYL